MPLGYNTKLLRSLEKARRKLLDTSIRNRLIHVNRKNVRSDSLDIINEHSDCVFSILRVAGRKMRFKPMGKDPMTADENDDIKLAQDDHDNDVRLDRLKVDFFKNASRTRKTSSSFIAHG